MKPYTCEDSFKFVKSFLETPDQVIIYYKIHDLYLMDDDPDKEINKNYDYYKEIYATRLKEEYHGLDHIWLY